MRTAFLPNLAPAATVSSASSAMLSENARVLCGRLAQLCEAGYSTDATVALALRPDIDLHDATDLLLGGCSQQTALRILL
jgi:hypothetical protein